MSKINLFALESHEDVIQVQEPDIISPSIIDDENFDSVDLMGKMYEDSNNINLLSQEIEQSLYIAGTLVDIKDSLNKTNSLDSNSAAIVAEVISRIVSDDEYVKRIPALESYGKTSSRSEATAKLKISLEGILKDIWEKIKAAFKKISGFLVDLYKKISSYIKNLLSNTDKTELSAQELEKAVKTNKPVKVATESNVSISLEDALNYDLEKPLTIVAYSFGEYLGDDKKEIDRYVDNIHNLDASILTLLQECSLGVDAKPLDISKISNEFVKPQTPEEIKFIQEYLGVHSEKAQVIRLPFKKGFIWHLIDESLGVKAGIRKTPLTYKVFKLPALTTSEVIKYMRSLKRDLAQNNAQANKLATQVTNLINARLSEIDRLSSNGHTTDDEITKHREHLNAAQVSLNSIKNIEFGFWQFKATTLTKIKQYCDSSIEQRSRDYMIFRKGEVK